VEYEFGNQRNFIREQRSALLANKFMRTLTQLAQVSEGEARQAAIRRMEQVQIEFVTLGARGPAADFEPDPDALQAYIASQEDELRALYEQRTSLYNMPEQVRERHILLSLGADASAGEAAEVELRANQILTQIREGADFEEELASTHSKCPSGKSGGDLGSFGPGQMVKEFDQVVFNEAVGEVHGPVKTQFGYHLLEVTSRTD